MSSWNKVLDVVKDVAPTIAMIGGTAVGGPAAGGILAALARKLTGSGENESLEDVAADLLGDPEKLQQFRLEARKLELEELRVRTLDVQDARKLAQVSVGAAVISFIVVLGYFLCVGAVLTMPIPEGSQNVAYLLLGTMGTGFGMVLTFWLGSSKGSKEKERIMEVYMKAAQRDQK